VCLAIAYVFSYRLDGDSSNPVILFLHGFMGDRYEFQPAIANLSQQFYCVAIDLPSHGQTDLTHQGTDQFTYQDSCYNENSCYTIEFTARLIIKFLELLNIERCFLVGYSMGGRVALYLTIHFPKYFSKVVLESASAGLRTDMERSDRLARDQQLADKLENLEISDFRLFLENWYQQKIFGNLRSHSNFPQLLEQRLQNSPRQLAKSLRYLSTGMQPSLWGDLPKIEMPLLLLVGELDTKFVQINQQIAQACKCSQLEIIPNCGHNIHFENPDIFVEKIQTFLETIRTNAK
jgi:2-succinyl-6-hydroxy-2,4-cyclohexadiene-1-carboxylate synthase